MPKFKEHLHLLRADAKDGNDDSAKVIEHLAYFLDFIQKEYQNTLATLRSLLEERKISFDLVWGVFMPGTVLVTHCKTTGEPLVVRLRSCLQQCANFYEPRHWALTCEFVDTDKGFPGYAELVVKIYDFAGAEVITSLAAFPLDPYLQEPRRSELCETLIKRGRRHWDLSRSWSHNDYSAIAYTAQGTRKMNVCKLFT